LANRIISFQKESLYAIANTVSQGGVIAFRTDTFYGLGADPFNRDAVQRIKQLKGREDNKPILIVISDADQVGRFISRRSPNFNRLVKQFWPGALTLIDEAIAEVPEEITAGTQTIGVRLPNDDRVRELVRACGGALTATSANPSQASPATNAQTVREYFGDAIDLIIDDGQAKTDRPSTVINVSSSEPKLLREGVIPWAEIESFLKSAPSAP